MGDRCYKEIAAIMDVVQAFVARGETFRPAFAVSRSQDGAVPSDSDKNVILVNDLLQTFPRAGFWGCPSRPIRGSANRPGIPNRNEGPVSKRDSAEALVGAGVAQSPGNAIARRQ